MDELLKISVPAIIALIGTFTVAIIGYRQWKRQQDKEGKQKFQDSRKDAYEKLWQMLEEIHVQIRTESVGKREFDAFVTEVNSFILKNGLYIAKVDTTLAIDYLEKVFRVSQLVAQSRDRRAKRAWMDTAALPPDTLKEHEELKTAWNEVDIFRDKIVSRFQQVLKEAN